MSCWKSGCREAWAPARVCRAPNRSSATHSVCTAAMVLGRGSRRPRCQRCGQRDGAGGRSRGRWRDPYLWAWLGLHPGPRDSPLQARDAGGGQSRAQLPLAPRPAAYVRGSDQDPPGPRHRGLRAGEAGRGSCKLGPPCGPQPGWGWGTSPGPLVPAAPGPGAPLTSPSVSFSKLRDPGRGRCSHCMSLALKGLVGWVLTGKGPR